MKKHDFKYPVAQYKGILNIKWDRGNGVLEKICFLEGFDENHKRALLDYHVYGGDIALSQDPQLMHGLYLTLRYKL